MQSTTSSSNGGGLCLDMDLYSSLASLAVRRLEIELDDRSEQTTWFKLKF